MTVYSKALGYAAQQHMYSHTRCVLSHYVRHKRPSARLLGEVVHDALSGGAIGGAGAVAGARVALSAALHDRVLGVGGGLHEDVGLGIDALAAHEAVSNSLSALHAHESFSTFLGQAVSRQNIINELRNKYTHQQPGSI